MIKYKFQNIDEYKKLSLKDRKKAPFKTYDQIKSVLDIVTVALENENIKLNIVVKDNCSVLGYQNEYAQVIVNLIINSKDIMLSRKISNPRIDVKIHEEDGFCITEVSDNGGGIKVEPIEKIFTLFYTSGKETGTGIGLYIAKLIIEKHMLGKLSAENSDNGAKFIIKLPL